jgi:hypothetical protein
VQKQDGKKSPMLDTTDREQPIVPLDLQRAKDPILDVVSFRGTTLAPRRTRLHAGV